MAQLITQYRILYICSHDGYIIYRKKYFEKKIYSNFCDNENCNIYYWCWESKKSFTYMSYVLSTTINNNPKAVKGLILDEM